MALDTIIIGGGLIGSAAARHLGQAGETVAVIGPDEPADAGSAVVFASHYDSGRVQRRLGRNDAMTRLNLLAIEHYGWLQRESGIRFHSDAGCLYVHPGLIRRTLALTIKSETVLLARVSLEESRRLAAMPSLLYDIDVPELEGIYAVAPVPYPDGHFYLKMGCNLPEDIYFDHDLSQIQQSFRSGNSDAHLDKMRRALSTIMPGVRFDDCITKRCILTRTASHGNPYIGQVDDQLHVAIGNGWSARCSDSIGRVATHLMSEGEFPEGFRSVDFEPVFAE